MPAISEHNRHMAMLRAAIPYVMPQSRQAIEILLQADALVHTARNYSSESAFSLESAELQDENESAAPLGSSHPFQPDPENMLLHIQEFCSPREADLIQTMLNIIRTRKLFRGYQEFQETHPLPHGDLEAASMFGSQSQLMEFLLSRLSPEQKTIFEQMQQIMYNDRSTPSERTSYDAENQLADS